MNSKVNPVANVEHWAPDKLGRAAVAIDFTRLIEGLPDRNDEAWVLCIDAPYGHGKTFFVERWRQDLERARAPYVTLMYNAWEFDYSNDAFTSFASEIIGQLTARIQKYGDVLKQTLKELALFYRIFWPMFHFSHEKSKEALEKSFESAKKWWAAASKTSDQLQKEKALPLDILKVHCEAQKGLTEFKKILCRAAMEIKNETGKPLVIFIDEIDRCKPTFAIRLLERIKHVFNASNIIFVVTTNKQSLAQSVKAVYGQNFESEEYLERFFDIPLTLPIYDAELFVEEKITNFSLPFGDLNHFAKTLPVAKAFALFGKLLHLNLREQKKALELARLSLPTLDLPSSNIDQRMYLLYEFLFCCCIRICSSVSFGTSGADVLASETKFFQALVSLTNNKTKRDVWKPFTKPERFDLQYIIKGLFLTSKAGGQILDILNKTLDPKRHTHKQNEPNPDFAIRLFQGARRFVEDSKELKNYEGEPIISLLMKKLEYIQLTDQKISQ